MTKKQRLLSTLTRQRLIEIASQFEIFGLTSYGKDNIVSALSRKRSVMLESLLNHLSKDELKGVCIEFGFDESGNEKSGLVNRIIEKIDGSSSVAEIESPQVV